MFTSGSASLNLAGNIIIIYDYFILWGTTNCPQQATGNYFLACEGMWWRVNVGLLKDNRIFDNKEVVQTD